LTVKNNTLIMSSVSKLIANLPESQTLAMTRLSRQLKQQGIDVVSMSLGEPDFDTPAFIKEAAIKALEDNYTHYTPVAGYADLKEAIIEKFRRDNGLNFKPSQIIASSGAKQSLSNLIYALIDPGDEVIIPSPYWVTYKDLVYLASGTCVFVHATPESEFKMSPEQLEAAITPRSKVIIFSSPCNPTGSVYTRDELKALAEVLERHPGIYVISDEIYEHINFVSQHESIAQFENIRDRVIIVNGVSKGFAMTGWRLGYMAAPEEIATACNNLQGQLTSAPCSITQKAAAAALLRAPADIPELQQMRNAFKNRRDLLLDLVKDIPGLKTNVPDGAFYIFPKVSYYFGKSDGDTIITDSQDLSMYLLNKGNVAVVPGDAFGCGYCLRISYAASNEQIIEGVRRIREALARLQ
jgi:aspartate aminotransferase